MTLETIEPRWQSCVVAAPGPSLKPFECSIPIIAVQDAWKLVPQADVLYGCEPKWWRWYEGGFRGELWSTHDTDSNDKSEARERWGVRCVQGKRVFAHESTFSLDPSVIHYGDNSGFQAINLAILFGCKRIVLTGFNMSGINRVRRDNDRPNHYERFCKFFDAAAERLEGVEIINATPDSALTCFPTMEFADAILLDQVAA